jgi:hypothetical protein
MSCSPGSNCCTSCSGLGQYPIPSGSHAIPYHLTEPEIQAFLQAHAGESALSAYLFTKQPQWGIIVNENYGELLVWFDASGVLQVVDVTNMNIASQVKLAPYESPDSGFFENIQQSFNDLFSAVQGVGVLIGVVALGYLVYRIAR